MAAHGTPLVACVNGYISSAQFNDVGLGGISLHVQGSHNDNYYYAHLPAIADGIQRGVQVSAGQVIGYVGDTGNARGGAYHLHFGMSINGASVNPYATLRSAWGNSVRPDRGSYPASHPRSPAGRAVARLLK